MNCRLAASRFAVRALSTLTLVLAGATSAYGVDFVSSQIDLRAQAEASSLIPADSDFQDNTSSATDVLTFADTESASASVSTSSSASGSSLTAAFTSNLITVEGTADATSIGGMDNPASAFGDASYEVVFSSMFPVDYQFTGSLISVFGDSNIAAGLTDLSDSSTVFVSQIFATGEDMPSQTGTLAAGSYRLIASVFAGTHADEFSGGFDSFGELNARLELTTVPEPGTLLLALCGMGALLFTRLGRRSHAIGR